MNHEYSGKEVEIYKTTFGTPSFDKKIRLYQKISNFNAVGMAVAAILVFLYYAHMS